MHQATETFHILRHPDKPELGDELVRQGQVFPSNHSYVTRAPLLFEELNVEDVAAPSKKAAAK